MEKEQIEDLLDQGGLLARAIVQIVGKPKEHIEKSLHDYMDQLKNAPKTTKSGFHILNTSFAEAELQEDSDSLYSAFCEVELACDDVGGLMDFCMDAMPSSVEITEPEEMVMRSHAMTDILNDFVGRMHQIDMIAKKSKQQQKLMSQSLGVMVQNAILILLNLGPRSAQSIAQSTGINSDQLPRFLEKLQADGKIIEKDGMYVLDPSSKQQASED